MASAVWGPGSAHILTWHIVARMLSWIHAHWLNAPALTAWATFLTVIAGLVPLYIWRRGRRETVARKLSDHVEDDNHAELRDAASANIKVAGDIPREPVAFQPRPDILVLLTQGMREQSAGPVCSLEGGRGVGKTQLAVAYARQCIRDGWQVVAWITAEHPGQITAGLAEVADVIGLRGPTQDAELAALSARQWLERASVPSLLVLDNAVDPDTVRRWLPRAGCCQTVITTTLTSFSMVGVSIDVGVFNAGEAKDFLTVRSACDSLNGVDDLAYELGFLPLALAQAAWLIRSRRITFTDYLQRLRELPISDLMPRVPGEPYPRGAAEAAVLAVSDASTAESTGSARELVGLIAVLSPGGVHRKLLYAAFSSNRSTENVDNALGALLDSSVLTADLDGGILIMHRLVQRILRDREQRDGSLSSAIVRAASVLKLLLPDGDGFRKSHDAGTGNVDHVNALWETAFDYGCIRNAAGEICEIGFDLLDLRRSAVRALFLDYELKRSCALGVTVLEDHLCLLGTDHPFTDSARSWLAQAYLNAGRADLAIPLRVAIASNYTRIKGRENPETLSAMNSLGFCYEIAGRLDKAIELHTTNLENCLRTLGPDHQITLYAQINLASAYRSVGMSTEALILFRKNAEDNKRAFGDEHSSTLNSRGELARMYERVGRYQDAIAIHERNIAYLEGQPGSSIEILIWWKRYLALAYQGGGHLEQAARLLAETSAQSKDALGADHPETIRCQIFLARTLQTAGKYHKSIELFEKVTTDRRRLLGSDYPATLNSRRNLANAYYVASRVRKAEDLLTSVLADYERILGIDHPYTKTARDNLSRVRRSAKFHAKRRRQPRD